MLPQNILLEILSGLCLVALSYIGNCFNFRNFKVFSNSLNSCCPQLGLTVKLTSGPSMSGSWLSSSHQTGQAAKCSRRRTRGLHMHVRGANHVQRHGDTECPRRAMLKWIQLSEWFQSQLQISANSRTLSTVPRAINL